MSFCFYCKLGNGLHSLNCSKKLQELQDKYNYLFHELTTVTNLPETTKRQIMTMVTQDFSDLLGLEK